MTSSSELRPVLAAALFSTPVAAFDLPDTAALNADLAKLILEDERTKPSWQRSTVAGWHSTPDLAMREEPAYRRLLQNVVELVAHNAAMIARETGAELAAYNYGASAYARVLRDGNYITPHHQGDAHWTAVYYVDAGDELAPPSGQIAFLDPRRTGRPIPGIDLFPSTFVLGPKTSLLVMFPAWVQHYVHPYRGTRPQIAITCSVSMEPARAK